MSPNVCLSATKVSKGHVESAAKRESVGESGIKEIHVGQVKYVRVKGLSNYTNMKTMTQRCEGRDMIYLSEYCPKWALKPHGRQGHLQSAILYPLRDVPLITGPADTAVNGSVNIFSIRACPSRRVMSCQLHAVECHASFML